MSSRSIDQRQSNPVEITFYSRQTPGYRIIRESHKRSIPQRGLIEFTYSLTWVREDETGGLGLRITTNRRGRAAGNTACPKNWFMI